MHIERQQSLALPRGHKNVLGMGLACTTSALSHMPISYETFQGLYHADNEFTSTFHTQPKVHNANPLITETERALEVLNPNKGAGTDGIFPKAVATLSPNIVPTLSSIVYLSFQTSQVPDDWHRTIFTPVAKSLLTTDKSLFRPIRPTSVVLSRGTYQTHPILKG